MSAVLKPENASHHSCGIVNSKKKAVILPNLEDNGACNGYFGQQKVISQDKEDFALILKELTQILMVECLIFALLYFLIASLLLLNKCLIIELLLLIVCLIMISLIILIAAVSQREHVVSDLQNEDREVQITHVEIYVL